MPALLFHLMGCFEGKPCRFDFLGFQFEWRLHVSALALKQLATTLLDQDMGVGTLVNGNKD